MKRTYLPIVCLMSACHPETLTDAFSADTALQSAQCTFQSVDTAEAECAATFQTCAAAEGADLEACREALRACRPPPPPPVEGRGVGCHGGPRGGPDGGFGPPPPIGGPGRPGGHGGHRGEPRPPPAELIACRDALDACLAAESADRDACLATGRACVRDAFAAIFAARCAEERAACAAGELDAELCARIETRCTQGIDAVPQNEDGTPACVEPVTQ